MIQSISESTERQSSGRMFKRKLQGIYRLRTWEYLKVSPSKYVSDRQIATHAEGCGICQARRKKPNKRGSTKMSATNGRAHGRDATTTMSGPPPTAKEIPVTRYSVEGIKQLVAALEVPFDPSQIEWRVMNTTKSQPLRGQVVPYADQRAYTDRLNALFTPAGWTRKYTIHTSANFERSGDQKIVAKVLVTCELTIFGLGSHSATGEEWADDDNAVTSAEAQSFKRASACFGLGRYFYYFVG